MNERRIVRADIFFCGGLVAAMMGCLMQAGFVGDAQLVWLVVVVFTAPMAGTLAALMIAGRPIAIAPFLWAFVGAVGAAFAGLTTVFVVYDLVLIAFAPIATVVFFVLLVRALLQDRRLWTRVMRLSLVPATVVILAVPFAAPVPSIPQPVGVWLAATWSLAGAALLAPVPWRLAPPLPDEAFIAD